MKIFIFTLLLSYCGVISSQLEIDESEFTTTSSAEPILENETAITTTTVLYPPISDIITQSGERESLETNLVVLYNMAIKYLPENLTYLNIIEAFREKNHEIVRYELLINTTNDLLNEEMICNLLIQENSSLLLTTATSQEVLFSNCSTTENNNPNQEFINDKYKLNTIFNNNNKNNELPYDLSQLESQIIEPKQKNHEIIDKTTATNINNNDYQITELSLTPVSETEILKIVKENDDCSSVAQNNNNNNNAILSEDAKEFLDNFFSYFNFGSNSNSNNNENSMKDITDDDTTLLVSSTHNSAKIKRSISENKKLKSEKLFDKFQIKYNKDYSTVFERQMRLQIFKSNLIKINQLNKKEQGTAKYGITSFSDLTTTEYKMRTGLLTKSREDNEIKNPIADIPDIKLPKQFDWRKKGVISKVKNQGNCGSCWAFSVTGNVEAMHAIKTGQLEEYSEQELLDCDSIDSACGGGLMDNAYKAIEKIGGLELENDYPYLAHKDKCHFNKSMSHVNIKGGVDLPKNETAMALWLIANGPISIGINANAMQFYRGGISHPWRPLCRHGAIDHGVLIVGFGISEYPLFNKTLPYWIVKNSWGPTWGEQGYYRVYRGDNTCGVNSMASSAIL